MMVKSQLMAMITIRWYWPITKTIKIMEIIKKIRILCWRAAETRIIYYKSHTTPIPIQVTSPLACQFWAQNTQRALHLMVLSLFINKWVLLRITWKAITRLLHSRHLTTVKANSSQHNHKLRLITQITMLDLQIRTESTTRIVRLLQIK